MLDSFVRRFTGVWVVWGHWYSAGASNGAVGTVALIRDVPPKVRTTSPNGKNGLFEWWSAI